MRALLAAMGILLASCTSGPITGLGGVPGLLASGLQPFDDCEDFLAYVKEHGEEHVTAWGLGGGWGVVALEADGAAAGAESRAETPTQGVDYSGTNIQTAGVDEPDIVKTDGERLLVLSGARLLVFDVSGDAPRKVGSLDLGDLGPRGLLLHRDRALVFADSWGGGGVPEPVVRDPIEPWGGAAITTLLEVDLSDPTEPTIARRLHLDGRYVSARLADGTARVVVSSFPAGLEFRYPEQGGLRAEREALRHNRQVIRNSTIEDWVPYHMLEDADGRVVAEGPLLDCPAAHHPTEFSGFDMLTVLTFDMETGLDDSVADASVGVLSGGETVYASEGGLYVATPRWIDPVELEAIGRHEREGFSTQIHRFDISGEGPAAHRSSGRVPGWLLNQFSMDEHEGRLRVASTDSPPFWTTQRSESVVTVLEERDGALVPVGSVGGLGEGERIYAVRFMGDLGYVVTFREVDPLYVVDLSDPTSPTVAGELKIPGYSAYLHPVGEGRLLGVGQDATSEGRTKGTQLSLFDVSDPSDPRRIDTVRITGGGSEAEWDHHAFLYWEPEGLVVVPVTVWSRDGFSGAMAVRLNGDRLSRAGTLTHEGIKDLWMGGIRRSLVVGDLLYTVSETGVEAADLETLEDVAWIPFR